MADREKLTLAASTCEYGTKAIITEMHRKMIETGEPSDCERYHRWRNIPVKIEEEIKDLRGVQI